MTTTRTAAKPNGQAADVQDAPQIVLSRLGRETVRIPIVGTAPLIVHAWSAKARQIMLDNQQGRKSPKANRDPQQDYEDSLYRTATGYGVPALAFKAATVSAARYFGKAVTMTALRQYIFVSGVPSHDGTMELTPITGEPRRREDMVKVGQGTDLRFRAEFPEWSAVVQFTYVPAMLALSSLVSLVDAGGLGVGICEWRPERSGQNGTFAVDETREIEIVPTR